MSYKAIYTYAWDLAETGTSAAIDEFQALGLDTVTIAGSYHAGKFLRPHGTAGKVYFPEDGTAYFATDASRYGAIKPRPNSMLAEHDVLRELTEDGRAAVNVWLVLLHNTALGVATIDNDYLNVAKVLKLGWFTKIFKIVIPSALPLIFTGLRLSLGVGWMVLIAAEMLAQNPGLGKFVWDMFQNGSSQTLAQIMVAVFTIGIIGFFLDRIMFVFQKAVSFDAAPVR